MSRASSRLRTTTLPFSDISRRSRGGGRPPRRGVGTELEIALAEIDRLIATGVRAVARVFRMLGTTHLNWRRLCARVKVSRKSN